MTLTGANPLLTLSIVLAAGVFAGQLARRVHLPSVTGQILAGILLGPSLLSLFEHGALDGMRPMTQFALGLIAVTVGSHLNFFQLRNAARRLLILLAFESILTPLLVLAVVYYSPAGSWELGTLLAAIAVSTAPATILAMVREGRAKGVFVKTLVAAVALNNIMCICLFEVAFTAARLTADAGSTHSLTETLMAPARQILYSVLLGAGCGIVLIIATRSIVKRDRLATASMIAILMTVGVAQYLEVSSLLSCMFLGLTLANLTPQKNETGHGVFEDFSGAIYAVFFTLAGMELDLKYALPGGALALAVIAARVLGKLGAGYMGMRVAGAPRRVRNNLGLALVPQAGVAVGLILLVQQETAFDPDFRRMILAVGLSVVLGNEIIGPILTRIGLKRSGDWGRDRARLIDFLHEENIVTDLVAETKEEAIARLADVLIQSNHLSADRDRLVQSIFDREEEMSTCLGGGLAVPHGILEEGEDIVGVMGLSRRGLDFDAIDGLPVHCMVLLATPPSKRKRHLEVLAALARAIGTDPQIQRQLFNAKSPAHAYLILHAEESEDFNYFLEDDAPMDVTPAVAG
ncbi:MAG: PTS system fructose-specific IIC component [Chlamydiales bacterium]|jgi:PTS system fructose-specific IIC component